MKGIILVMKTNITPNAHGGVSYGKKYTFKEITVDFSIKSLINKLKKAGDSENIINLYYFDTNNAGKEIFEEYDERLIKKTTDKRYIISEIKEILDFQFNIKLTLAEEFDREELKAKIDKALEKELGENYYEEMYFATPGGGNSNGLDSLYIDLAEHLINWETNYEVEDDDFDEPNFEDYQELKRQIKLALVDFDFIKDWNLDYSEKHMLTLTINFK